MTNGLSGAVISSLLYVKSNTFKNGKEKITKRKKSKYKKKEKILHLQQFCTSNK